MNTNRMVGVDKVDASETDADLDCQSDINQKLHLLIVEKNPIDCELIKTYLAAGWF